MANTTPTFIEVQEIAKILPTGYYLGTRINYEVIEDLEASYFDPMQFIIKISYKQIAPYITSESLEDDIRCLLYHEVSHAMLTPRDTNQNTGLFKTALEDYYVVQYSNRLRDYYNSLPQATRDWSKCRDEIIKKDLMPLKPYWKDLVNIFEDQRIETINKDLFMRVDFPNFVKKVNDYDNVKNEPITNVEQLFYKVVRFNDICPNLVKKTYDIIYKFADVNAVNTDNLGYYVSAIFDLACECKDLFLQQTNQQQLPNGQAQPQEGETAKQKAGGSNSSGNQAPSDEEEFDEDAITEDGGNKSEEDNPSQESSGKPQSQETNVRTNQLTGNSNNAMPEVSEDEAKKIIDSIVKKLADDEGMTPEEVLEAIKQQAIKEVLGQYDCTTNFNQSAERIILRMLRKKSIEAKSIAGYSGRINPKNIHRPGRVENYRWFDKANPNGINATAGKFRINFFCDNSGSFNSNRNKANSIIRCLYNMSKRYAAFDFSLVTNGDYPKLRNDQTMAIECNEGTYLPSTIYGIYGELQKIGQNIWNIVLFDGGLIGADTELKNYAVFNHSNVIMICDNDDEQYIRKYCPNAHKIFTKHYLAELEDNLIKCMDQMFR